MPDAQYWTRVEALFNTVRDCAAPVRAQRLEELCPDDPSIRAEVMSLLQSHDQSTVFLETPAVAVAEHAEIFHEPELLAGATLGRYRIAQRIGSGGMGTVYEAVQENPRRRVALKVMRPAVQHDGRPQSFDREIEALARVRHPAIAAIYEAAIENGRHFYAMELVRGEPLISAARTAGMDQRRRLELFVYLCDVVAFAHQRGVIHGDLKPANILAQDLPAEGLAHRAIQPPLKILDFGLARIRGVVEGDAALAGAAPFAGSLPYMSPEQARGETESIDVRSDVYALGVILYELLTEQLPHDLTGLSIPDALAALETQPPVPLRKRDRRLAGDLSAIVAKALQKEPERRYPSALALGEDVARHLARRPVSARPATPAYRLSAFVRRNRTGVLVASMVAGVMTGLIGLAHRSESRARETEARLQAHRDSTEKLSGFLSRLMALVEGRSGDITLRELLDAASTQLSHTPIENPDASAAAHAAIGNFYRTLGRYEDAEQQLRGAISTRPAQETPDSALLSTQADLGAALLGRGDLAGAERMLRAVLAEQRRQLDESDPEIGRTLRYLGSVLTELGKLDEAITVLRDSLEATNHTEPADPLAIIATLRPLAAALEAAGERDEAEAHLQQALQLRLSAHGPNHPLTAEAHFELGRLLHRIGRVKGAEDHLTASLTILKQVHGPRHADVATVVHTLGDLLRFSGRHPEGESLLREALTVREELLGPDHPVLIANLRSLAFCLQAQERYDEARAHMKRVVDLQRKYLGNSAATAEAAADLAHLDFLRGELELADAEYCEALQIMRKVHGSAHVDVGRTLRHWARVLNAQGRHADAVAALQESIEIRARSLPMDDPRLEADRAMLAEFQAALASVQTEAIPAP